MTELENFVMNLGLAVSAYCNGDHSKSMPITKDEWDKLEVWEKEVNRVGSISYWVHVE